jgi:hypothetical protein
VAEPLGKEESSLSESAVVESSAGVVTSAAGAVLVSLGAVVAVAVVL